VLCYLQGATRDEAAQRLGCPLATLKKRLERGRDRLHAALVRRGLGLSAVLLGTLVTRQTADAAAAVVLARPTARAALALAARRPVDGAISSSVNQLVQGGVSTMGSKKVKGTLALMLVGGLLASAGALAYGARDDRQVPTTPQVAPAPQDKKADPPAAARALRVVVLDPQGKPLAGANVHVGIWTDEKDFKAKRDYETDAAGAAQVELPKSFSILRLWAWKKSFASMFANWERNELASGKNFPAEYTFRLEPGVTAGGRVVDEQGQPIPGARVQVRLASDPQPANGDGRVRYNNSLAYGSDAATTDAEGRWRIDNVPNHPQAELILLVAHPH
jgi:hypothetical protein